MVIFDISFFFSQNGLVRVNPFCERKKFYAMKKNFNYTVTLSGERDDRERLAGKMVSCAANLITGIRNNAGDIVFYFRYQSDAKLVLRNVSRSFRLKQTCTTVVYYGAAQAKISTVKY